LVLIFAPHSAAAHAARSDSLSSDARATHTRTVALPFTSLRLRAARPSVFPRGYPQNPATLGEHLRRRRLDLGLPQRILAERWRVTRETVAGWELGRNQPSIRHWPIVLSFLGHDPGPTGLCVGDRIRAYRRQLGLTQSELAAQFGLDAGTVLDLESGRRTLSARVSAIVERLLGRR
jgi:transcriptional regulator with XRE-family HTH domain